MINYSPNETVEDPIRFDELNQKVSHEFVGGTEISKFEDIWGGLISNKEIADYLRKNIFMSHLENCQSIKYDANPHPVSSSILGMTTLSENGQDITVYAPNVWFNSSEGAKQQLLDALVHEVGHNVHVKLFEQDPVFAEKWKTLFDKSKDNEFVSWYAKTSEYEDFAESFKTYVRDPELLKMASIEKYDLMKQIPFSGREYNAPSSESNILQQGEARLKEFCDLNKDGVVDWKDLERAKQEVMKLLPEGVTYTLSKL